MISIFLLSSRFLSLETIRSESSHRERIAGWVGKYSILSIQFSRKMTRPSSRGTRRPFNQILSLKVECATRGGRERGSKEKNKFDQSEGDGYRFGYGFRKHRRILFLRKPDKSPLTRIFSHTRRPYAVCVPRSRDGKIADILSYYPSIDFSLEKKKKLFFQSFN